MRAPALAADPHNPRAARLNDGRGRILASDGTPLAVSHGARRDYPLGALTAHAVGYASERYGTSGLEHAFDGVLRAPAPAGDPLADLRSIVAGGKAPPRGSDVVTTLDLGIQRALAAGLARYRRGAGVVLDPRSGAVLALVSQPSYEPNGLDAHWSSLANDASSTLLDRAIDGLYPPGSTFKTAVAGMALEQGVVTPQSVFDDPGTLTVGDYVVHDDEGEVPGTLDLTGAFALSSNVDFAQIALKLGVDGFERGVAAWRLGASLDFDLPANTDRIPPRAEIAGAPGVLAQLGFGQASLLVTPLRMALVAATIAHGGSTPRPYLVRTVAGRETSIATTPETLAQPLSAANAAIVAQMMRAVVARGTGTVARLPDVTVAGKTGTATNPQGASHSWFIAFAPAEAPRVAVAVVVENVGYGATYAAPIAREVVRVALARRRS